MRSASADVVTRWLGWLGGTVESRESEPALPDPPPDVLRAIAPLGARVVIPLRSQADAEGALQIGSWKRKFGCWKRTGHGVMDANAAMKQSCDVWFYVEGMATGVEAIGAMARELGLGQGTGLDIGNEYDGLVPSPDWKQNQRGEDWWNGDTAQLSIGQSFLLVTPLQMAVVTAALANGGKVLQPYVVSRIENNAGETLEPTRPRLRHQVAVARGDLEITRRTMLAAVHDSDGTAHRAAVRGLAVAGKTGTAEFDLYEIGRAHV